MAEIEDEMKLKIARDDSAQHRQLKTQEYVVKILGGGIVALKFVNNCFRKHFVLPSKKGTSSQTKAENRTVKRYHTSAVYKSEHSGATHPDKKALQKRYGDGANINTAVDLTSINSHLAFAKIATAAREKKDWGIGPSEIEVDFGTACVFVTTVQGPKMGETENQINTQQRNKMVFTMKKVGEGSYEVIHGK